MIPGEVTLKTAPLVDTRVARLNRAPDGQLRIALVDTATGLEFASFVLVERTVEAVRRVTEAVRVVREKLVQGAAAPPTPRSTKARKQVKTVEGTPVSSVRLFWPDGRMRPMPGDVVWTTAPGLYGAAVVRGNAVKHGAVVKIDSQGKKHPASERWNVEGDPVIAAQDEAKATQKQAAKAEKQRIMREAVDAVNAHARSRDMVPVSGIAELSVGDKLYRIASEGAYGDGDPRKTHETQIVVRGFEPSGEEFFYQNEHGSVIPTVASMWWRKARRAVSEGELTTATRPAVEATHHQAPRGLSSGVSIGHLFSINVKRWEQANRNVATLQRQRSFRSNKDRQAHATALGRAQEAVDIARVSNELLSDNKIPEGEREERFKALWMNVPASAYSETVKQ